MKTSLKKSAAALALTLLVGTNVSLNSAYAENKSGGNISGTTGAPATIPGLDIFRALFLRTHTVSIDNHIAEMKRDGVKKRKYVAAFTIEGALAYDHEFDDQGLMPDESNAGRNAGFQFVPYEVSIGSDERAYIRTSLIAFRNMNSEVLDHDFKNLTSNYRGKPEPFWTVVDNLDIGTWEYDNDIAKGIREHTISLIKLDLKVGLFKSDSGNFFVALKGGADPIGGSLSTTIKDFYSNGASEEFSGFRTKLMYGLTFNYQNKGWRVEGGVDFSNTWSMGRYTSQSKKKAYAVAKEEYNQDMDQYRQEMDDYNYEKQRYEAENGYEKPISQESYTTITGNIRPSSPQEPKSPSGVDTLRHQYMLSPYLSVSKRLNKSGVPMRLGVKLSGDIPLNDVISGKGIKRNLADRGNGTYGSASLFFNW